MERSSPRYPMYTERDPGRRKWVARTGRDDGRGLKTRRLELGMFFYFLFYFTNLLHTAVTTISISYEDNSWIWDIITYEWLFYRFVQGTATT